MMVDPDGYKQEITSGHQQQQQQEQPMKDEHQGLEEEPFQGDEDLEAAWPQKEPEKSKVETSPPARIAGSGIFELRRVFTTKLWHCRACSYADKDKDAAIEHLKVAHINPQRTKCKYCSTRCYSRKALLDHVAFAHPGKKVHFPAMKRAPQRAADFECPQCQAKFQAKKEWEDHLNACVQDLKCSHCAKSFPMIPSGYSLVRQQVLEHEKACSSRKSTTSGRGPEVPCLKCGMTFKYRKWMESHLKVCVQEIDCSLCGKTYHRGNQTLAILKKCVKDHEKICATKTEAQRHKIKMCPYCEKDFSKWYNLRRHMQSCHMREGRNVEEYVAETASDDKDEGLV